MSVFSADAFAIDFDGMNFCETPIEMIAKCLLEELSERYSLFMFGCLEMDTSESPSNKYHIGVGLAPSDKHSEGIPSIASVLVSNEYLLLKLFESPVQDQIFRDPRDGPPMWQWALSDPASLETLFLVLDDFYKGWSQWDGRYIDARYRKNSLNWRK